MKKLIAILSTLSALGFAVALANVNTSDNPSGSSDMSNSGSMSGDTSGSMSGTAPSDSSGSDMSKDLGSEKSTVKKHEKWTSAKSCTDENGVTFYKGKSGFQACVDKMKKQDQMGGTSPSDSSGSIMDKTEHSESTTVSPPDSSSKPNS